MQALPATVVVALDQTLNRFQASALGAGLDGLDQGGVNQVYTRRNMRWMAGAGLGTVTYRLRTELGVEDWHWNPRGRWSDPRHRQGYWTSSAVPSKQTVRVTYGYRLPRRGDSIDQANDDGYSRLDDGSAGTFWKSDPYLDPHFTHEPPSLHPQWIMIAFRDPVRLDAIRLRWAAPYARRIRAEYWVGRTPVYFYDHPGHWVPFARARFRGRPGLQTFRVARRPVRVRFVRLVLSGSSHTSLTSSHDIRDRLGFAVREIYAGTVHGRRFKDLIRHTPHGYRQTTIYVSSTDPWHRAIDRDPHTEQPSFQTVMASGLTRGQPLMVPVPVLYANPADGARELRYLRALHAPVGRIELGEEPDGQLASPEDYGTLFAQAARAIHRIAPAMPLGGPGYQTAVPDWKAWANASGQTSWTRRFLDELTRTHQRLGFFSFEWYPFDNGCAPPGPQLERQPQLLAQTLANQTRDGLPPSVPKVISEYGWSAFANRAEVSLAGALMDADIAASFLANGGNTPYLYGYEPQTLIQELARCQSWGNLMLLQSNDAGAVIHPMATWWGMRMVTRDWVQPGSGLQTMHPTSVSGLADPAKLAAYAITRPDGRQSLLLLNKDPQQPLSVTLSGTGSAFSGPLNVQQLSSAQYVWHAHGERGYPRPDRPPAAFTTTPGAPLLLPPDSLTVATT